VVERLIVENVAEMLRLATEALDASDGEGR
jgi:hypothetical protein